MSKIKKLLTYLLGVTFAVVLALACVTLGVNNKANAAETADDFKVSSIGIRLQDNAVDTGVRFGVRIKSELLEKTGAKVTLYVLPQMFYAEGAHLNAGATMAEADFLVKNQFRDILAEVVGTLGKELPKNKKDDDLSCDVRADVCRSFMELYAKTITEKATDELFTVYGCGRECAVGGIALKAGLSNIDNAKKLYRSSEEISERLRKKYRDGITPREDYAKKYAEIDKTLSCIRSKIEVANKTGVLYCDFMMHDGFGTPNAKIKIKYAGEDEKTLYSGGVKPSYTGFECGGVYTLMFLLGDADREIEYMVFSSSGEGQTFPLNFRYSSGDREYAAATVEKICGEAYFENNVVYPDTRFAILGNGDGEAHFNDVGLGKIENSIKIRFEEVK